MGQAMFTIIGAIAELESSLISERVKGGMEAARTRGKRLGRPSTPSHLVTRTEELAGMTDREVEGDFRGNRRGRNASLVLHGGASRYRIVVPRAGGLKDLGPWACRP
jgi:hypothetical protein